MVAACLQRDPARRPLPRDLAEGLAGRGDFVCHGDTVFGSPTLAYGEAVRVGDAVCESRENGVECTVASTRHGFTMSRTRYTLF